MIRCGQFVKNPASSRHQRPVARGRPEAPTVAATRDRPGRRILVHGGMLLGSGSLAGALGLAATALATLVLGPTEFGSLALLHALALTGAALARFNGWQAILRYGPSCLEERRTAELRSLVLLLTLLDLAAGLLVLGLLQAALPRIAPLIGLPEAALPLARWYLVLVLVAQSGTAMGMLRLLDRFDLVALLRPTGALTRLLGVAWVWLAGGGLAGVAAVWLLAALVEAGALAAAAAAVMARARLLSGPRPRLLGLARAHPGLWRVLFVANLNASLGLLAGRLVTLLVGGLLGPAAAGLYQVAQQLAGAVERPLEILRRSVEPELARLRARGERTRLERLARRLGWAVPVALLPVPVAAWLGGGPALVLLFGPGFAAAAPLLVLLLIRQVVLAAALPGGALLVVAGSPSALLYWKLAARGVHLLLLPVLLPLAGLEGAGLAAVVGAAVETGLARRLAARTGGEARMHGTPSTAAVAPASVGSALPERPS